MKLELVLHAFNENPSWVGGASARVPDKLVSLFDLSSMPSGGHNDNASDVLRTAPRATNELKVDAAMDLAVELTVLILQVMGGGTEAEVKREFAKSLARKGLNIGRTNN